MFKVVLLCVLFSASNLQAAILINEFCSSNSRTIADEDGEFSDWIELYNSGDYVVDLEGYGISDSPDVPFRWVVPRVQMAPEQFLVVWASGKNRRNSQSALHTNFRLKASGGSIVLTHSDGRRVDEVGPVELGRDLSFGRIPDAGSQWVIFSSPSPGASNPESNGKVALPVTFSQPPGYHEQPFWLEIKAPAGAAVHYTLDGTEPSPSSPRYHGPLFIEANPGGPNIWSQIRTTISDGDDPADWWEPPAGDVYKSTVVRARAFQEGFAPGRSSYATYFVGPKAKERYTLPVISLITDPANLFDPETGIYVAGHGYDGQNWETANYAQGGREWERPVHLEFFETDGALVIGQEAGMRIHGGFTRRRFVKSLRLYARREYGPPVFSHKMFADREVSEFKTFLLRNSGNDVTQTLMRDGLMQTVVKDLRFDTQAYRPAIVFVNGEYWGLHNLRERLDKHYLETHYGILEGGIDLLEKREQVIEGDSVHWADLNRFLQNHNLASPEHYAHFETLIDVDNFIDYKISQIYFRNTDWPDSNIKYWRRRAESYIEGARHGHDGRWRWFMFDTDGGFGFRGGPEAYKYDMLPYVTAIDGPWALPNNHNRPFSTVHLSSLLANETFRQKFVTRFADLLNTTFAPERVLPAIDSLAATIEPEIQEHINRWRRPGTHTNTWKNHVGVLRDFAAQRPSYQRQHLIGFFGLPGMADIHLSSDKGGTVRINTLALAPGESLSGAYFSGVPVRLQALPLPGHQFGGWTGVPSELKDNADLLLDVQQAMTVRATFEAVPELGPLSPAPFDLRRGTFELKQWARDEPPGLYPPHMLFLGTSTQDPAIHAPLELPWTNRYSLTSRSRITGLGPGGISFINTGNPQTEHEGFLGAALLALNTQDQTGVAVSWTGGTVTPNERSYGLRLQYRVGDTGPFADVLDPGGSPIEYRRHHLPGHTQSFGPILLPAAALGQPYVQLRWIYHFTGFGSGPRAELRLGQVYVTGTTAAPHLSIARLSGNSLLIEVSASPLSSGYLEGSLNLDSWETIASLETDSAGTWRLTTAAAEHHFHFFRVRLDAR
jgi:hypothetical protein